VFLTVAAVLFQKIGTQLGWLPEANTEDLKLPYQFSTTKNC
jgi:hypothetical protein